MADARYVGNEPICPACGAEWRYEKDGKRYSHVIGIYDQRLDRTVAWRCPSCNAEWDRSATIEGTE